MGIFIDIFPIKCHHSIPRKSQSEGPSKFPSPCPKAGTLRFYRHGLNSGQRTMASFGADPWCCYINGAPWIPSTKTPFMLYLGASQNRRSGTSSGTTPVPYPRSIPPFHTSLKDPFHTSVPYLWSIRYYIYIYIQLYIYIYLIMCNLILHLYAHIWAHVHTWVYTCKNTFTMPSPVIVLASLCLQHLQLLPTLLCDGRDVLGCCQLAV